MESLDEIKKECSIKVTEEEQKAYRPTSGSYEIVTIVSPAEIVAGAYKRAEEWSKKQRKPTQ